MHPPNEGTLQRSLDLPDVIALGINGVIGQGIFLLPGLAVARLGPAAIAAVLVAGAISFLIALCFAEVGSRFTTTGGAYVYAREAFGDFVGFEVGWMTCCVAVIAWAALANGLTVVLGHFIPAVASGWLQPVTAIAVMAFLAGINLVGARQGALISTLSSVAKLIPLLLFVAVGFTQIDGALFEPFAPMGWGGLAETTLLVLYAFVGFETLVVPAGEMTNPRRNVPLAMLAVMTVVTLVYVSVLAVSIGTFPGLAGHPTPVSAAALGVLGPIGGTLVAGGIVISVFGTNAGAALVSPRRFFAMADRGDLPRFLARVHPRTGVPWVSVLVTFALAAALTLTGTFKELATLSVVARFVQYIPTCLAAIVLRRRDTEEPQGFRLPFGPALPILTVGLCCWLLANTAPEKLLIGCGALAVGVPLYLWKKRGEMTDPSRTSPR
jgi:amino acid transporter